MATRSQAEYRALPVWAQMVIRAQGIRTLRLRATVARLQKSVSILEGRKWVKLGTVSDGTPVKLFALTADGAKHIVTVMPGEELVIGRKET